MQRETNNYNICLVMFFSRLVKVSRRLVRFSLVGGVLTVTRFVTGVLAWNM